MQTIARFFSFWYACAKRAASGSASFANDWQWVFGIPAFIAILSFFAASKPGDDPMQILMPHYPVAAQFLAALAAFVITFAIIFVLKILNAPVVINAELRDKVLSLETRLSPRLKCSFSESDPGCVRRGIPVPGPDGKKRAVNFYRIKVETDGSAQVSECCGRLLSIKLGEQELFSGNPCRLPFSPSDSSDAVRKTIREGAPEYLDCVIIAGNEVSIWVRDDDNNAQKKHTKHFHVPGNYVLQIVILSNTTTVGITLLLKWRGSQETAEMSCLAVST